MSRTYDVDRLAQLSAETLTDRIGNITARMEQRAKDADKQGGWEEFERAAWERDKASVLAHEEALEHAQLREDEAAQQARATEAAQERSKAIQTEIAQQMAETRVQRGGDIREGLKELEQRAWRGEGFRMSFSPEQFDYFERSTTTALAGAAHVAPAPNAAGGIWMPIESGAVNLRLNPGDRIEGGVYPVNAGVAATAEGATKPVLDPSSLGVATVSAFAVASNVSVQSEASGNGVAQLVWAAGRKVRKSVNDSFVQTCITAAGAARAFATSAVVSMDGALATSMDLCAATPNLIVCDVSIFSALASAGGGQASTAAVPAYRGIRLVPSGLAAIAGNGLVIEGSGIAMSLSEIEVRSAPVVMSNSSDVAVEAWFAAVVRGASSVIYQDATTP